MRDMNDVTIPAENDRRARVYDALWEIAYYGGSVKLDVVGTHGIDYLVQVGHRGEPSFRGDLEAVERQVVEYAATLGRERSGSDD